MKVAIRSEQDTRLVSETASTTHSELCMVLLGSEDAFGGWGVPSPSEREWLNSKRLPVAVGGGERLIISSARMLLL